MSRKVIRDFIKQADILNNSQAEAQFEKIIELYEDSVHSENERIKTLESDTLWLLSEYRKIIKTKDNTPEEKQKNRIAQNNIGNLLFTLIASTADKGIYLSEAFLKQYEQVECIGFTFGDYVRNCYNARNWMAGRKPQPETPQQANNGSDVEKAGHKKRTKPEPLQLPQELSTQEAKAHLKKAIELGLLDNTYKWLKGLQMMACFAVEMSNKLNLGKGTLADGRKRISWKPFEILFNIEHGKLRLNYNDVQKTGKTPNEMNLIYKVFE